MKTIADALDFNLVEEIETTLGEAAKRGIFVGINAEDWNGRAAARPHDKLFIYTHPQIKTDEDGFVEDMDKEVPWVIFFIEQEPAIFGSVQHMMSQEPWVLRRYAPLWVK